MIISISNLSSESVEIPSDDSIITLGPNVTKQVVFNSTDSTTFHVGYHIFRKGCTEILTLLDEGKIELFVDDNSLTSYALLCMTNKLNDDIFVKTNIPFEPSSRNKMYFSLETNELRIFNPISNKWYGIKLNEIGELT